MTNFHLGDILSITTGRLVSPRKMEGVYDILNFMTGDNLFTHQLPRAADTCRPVLLEQHQQLRDVDASTVTDKATAETFLAAQIVAFGETLPVTPLATWTHKHPVQELADRVIVMTP